MIPPRDQLPGKWQDLRAIQLKLPKLFPNVPWTCPVKRKEILDYLAVEAPGGSQSGSVNVVSFDLRFVRTAKINESRYWLWAFRADGNLDCYVAVQVNQEGQETLGFDEAFGLTPEQWMVMDYYDDWDDEAEATGTDQAGPRNAG